jgi:hypothetical protein
MRQSAALVPELGLPLYPVNEELNVKEYLMGQIQGRV